MENNDEQQEWSPAAPARTYDFMADHAELLRRRAEGTLNTPPLRGSGRMGVIGYVMAYVGILLLGVTLAILVS